MNTIQINAEIVVCAVEVIAEPGDRLVIWDGKCIGVHTGTGAIKAIRPTAPVQIFTDKMILEAIAPNVQMTTRQVADCLHVTRRDMTQRAAVGNAIRRLVNSKLVEAVPGDSRRTPAWRLVMLP